MLRHALPPLLALLAGIAAAAPAAAAPAVITVQAEGPAEDAPGVLPEPGPGENPGEGTAPPDDPLSPESFATPDPAIPDSGDQTLDELYARLAEAKTPAEAHPFEQRILKRLVGTGSATLDLMIGWSTSAAAERRFPVSLDLLDQVLMQKPDYAEGYNRRATIHYMQDDYARAIADIERTLALQPRHFGALAGLGSILRELGDERRALEVYRRAAAVHPNLSSVRKAIEELTPAVEGRPI